jgi:predicted transcriptional regulator
MKQLTISLSPEIRAEVDRIARQEDRSRSSLVNHILRAAIARRVTVETQQQSEQPPK